MKAQLETGFSISLSTSISIVTGISHIHFTETLLQTSILNVSIIFINVYCGDYVFLEKSPCGADKRGKARFSEFRSSLNTSTIS